HVVGALAVDHRDVPAGRITDPRLLDLDHISSEIGQDLASKWARQHSRQVEHSNLLERRLELGRLPGRALQLAGWKAGPVRLLPGPFEHRPELCPALEIEMERRSQHR